MATNKKKDHNSQKVRDKWVKEMHRLFDVQDIFFDVREIKKKIAHHIDQCQLQFKGFITNSMVFVVDHTSMSYLFVSENTEAVLGVSRETILSNGFNWLFSLFTETELLHKQQLMADIYSTLQSIRPEDVYYASSRYNVEVVLKNGERKQLIEEMMYPLISKEGIPLITTAFVHDITGLATGENRWCKIELARKGKRELLFEKFYVIHETKYSVLSKREMMVLECFAEGLTAKRTAQELSISEHTVNNHRKNILAKLNVTSTNGALKVAFQNRWLK